MSQCDITIPHGVPEVGGVGHRHAGEGELAEHGLDTMLSLLTQCSAGHMIPSHLLRIQSFTIIPEPRDIASQGKYSFLQELWFRQFLVKVLHL